MGPHLRSSAVKSLFSRRPYAFIILSDFTFLCTCKINLLNLSMILVCSSGSTFALEGREELGSSNGSSIDSSVKFTLLI